jgi:hypothetical protein
VRQEAEWKAWECLANNHTNGPLRVAQWLKIKEGDSEKTRNRKKKLLKSLKSKLRFQVLDEETKAKQDNWKKFIKGKGSKKVAGFLSSKCAHRLLPGRECAGAMGWTGHTSAGVSQKHTLQSMLCDA